MNETSTIVVIVPRMDKARFVQAAYPGKLSDWILKTLRKQAAIDLKESTK